MGNTSSRIHSAATADPLQHLAGDFLESPEAEFSAESFLSRLNLNHHLDDHRNEFLALSHENDPELFFESLFNLARRLENEDHLEAASRIYSEIVGAGLRPARGPALGGPLQEIAERSQLRLAAILGEGSGLERIEFLSRRLARQAMDPAALFAMTAAGAVFKVVQFAAMSRLAATPLGQNFASRILAGTAGFAAEVPIFTAASRVGNALLGREQIWTREEMGRELASGAIVLGCLRTVGGIFSLAGNRWALNQTGTFTGIFVGHKLEEWVGLSSPHDNATTLIDSASTFIQFNIAGRLNHEILPERYHRWERSLEYPISTPSPRCPMSDVRWTIRNLLLAPAFMFLSVGGIGGGGPPGRRPSARRLAQSESQARIQNPHEYYRPLFRELLHQVENLEQKNFHQVAPAILEAVAKDHELPFEVWLGRALRGTSSEMVEPWLDYLFNPHDPQLNQRSTQVAWIHFHHLTGGVPRLRAYLRDPSPETRSAALETLEKFLGPEAIPDLLSALSDQNIRIRLAASAALFRHGVNAPLPAERALFANATEQAREEFFMQKLGESLNTPLDPDGGHRERLRRDPQYRLQQQNENLIQSMPERSIAELLLMLRQPDFNSEVLHAAIEELAHRQASEALSPLRELLWENEFREHALWAMDQIHPEWDDPLRGIAPGLMQVIADEWALATTRQPWLETMVRLWGEFHAMKRFVPPAGLTVLAGLGTGLAMLADPSVVHAASHVLKDFSESGVVDLITGLGGMTLGAAIYQMADRRRHADVPIHQRPTLILAQGEKGSLPPPPPSHGEPLGWFENVYQTGEIFPIENPTGTPEITVGRSTRRQRNVFPPDLRQISRGHLDLRERAGNIEVRLHEGSHGVRINHANLAPYQWYRLHDRDVVEFVSDARRDIEAVNADDAGKIFTETQRLSEDTLLPLPNIEEVDRPAVFLFRRRLPGQADFFGRAWDSIKKTLRPSQFPTIPLIAPPSDRPPLSPTAVTGDPEEIFREVRRLSEDLRGSIVLLEAGLNRAEHQRHPREVLQSLLLIHQSFCGTSQRTVPVEEKDNPLTPPTLRMIRVPNWEGRILARLHYFETAVESFSRERKATPHLGAAREEIAHLRDCFSRLLELVRLFRRHYARREEQALFAAIEDAYRGLRPEGAVAAEQVRSATQSLDVTVRREQRQRWAEEFTSQRPTPPSLAIFNMRVMLGEISKVKGQEVAGSFYQALAGGTLYEGMRAVRSYYDVKSGELVAFSDGSRRVYRAIAELQGRGRRLQEVSIFVDALQSGRITDIAGISPETRESLGNALLWLRGLQVLPGNNP